MILDLLEKNRDKNPNKICLVDENESITIDEFVNRAKKVATKILELGHKNRAIAVEATRTLDSLVGFYGALYSGNFFMPVDSTTPADRLKKMISISEPVAYLKSSENSIFDDKNFIDLKNLEEIEIDEEKILETRKKSIDIDPCYMIWTSGSTGDPKGVLINHMQAMELFYFLKDTFLIKDSDVIANQSPFYFDGAMKDVFLFGGCGVKLVIVPKKYFALPINLVSFLNENKVNVMLWAVSALNILVNSKVLEKENLKYVDRVAFSGESFQTSKLNYLIEKLDATFVNLYGPSETTVDCCFYKVDREFKDDEMIPIGFAVPNMEVFLVDENLNENSEKGEIIVRGSKLSSGYYRDNIRTEKSFIQDPRQDYFRDIVYRTGDIAKYNDKKELVFLSREDDQVKHMGSRIELGEIDSAISSMNGVFEGASIYDRENSKIVYFYSGEEFTRRDLFKFLRDKLPKYMCPNEIINLESLPKNRNGKIDRLKLREIYEKNRDN